jgi:polyisoprenoid-binding protein YceI
MKTGVILFIATSTTAFTTISEKNVDVEQSTITWKGYKVTGQHEGTIELKEGTLLFEGNKLKGGSFIVDMASITDTDLEGEWKGKLEGHLKSDDFFGVEKHPTANLTITKVEPNGDHYTVNGDLTIKDITNPITFDMTIDENSAKASLNIDRSKFDVRYGSPSFFNNLKDKAIYDEFELNVNLSF